MDSCQHPVFDEIIGKESGITLYACQDCPERRILDKPSPDPMSYVPPKYWKKP